MKLLQTTTAALADANPSSDVICGRRRNSDMLSRQMTYRITEISRMFWTIILPAQATFYGLAGILVLAMILAPRFKRSRESVLLWGLLLSFVVFVPSCTIVMVIADFFRFGVFSYPDFRSVRNRHVQEDLPEAATDITVQTYAAGHRAKFRVRRAALEEWHERQWNRYGAVSTIPKAERDVRDQMDAAKFQLAFSQLKWTLPNDAVRYNGPFSPRGAGYEIWHSESEQTAYESASYW